jgi:hypothetical protein
MSNKRHFEFIVIGQEVDIPGNKIACKTDIRLLGADYHIARMLCGAVLNHQRARNIIAGVVRRWARQDPEWWSFFKQITDMQLSDPPQSDKA